MKQEVKDKATKYSETNYARPSLQSPEDASYIQAVSYHSFIGGYNLAQEEYAAQSKGMRWSELNDFILWVSVNGFKYDQSTHKWFTTKIKECDLKSYTSKELLELSGKKLFDESTQEGGTVEEVFEQLNPQDGSLPEWAKKVAINYASQVSATDKKRISELEKEIERLKGLVEEAYSSAYNKGYMDCRDKVTNNEPPFDQFKQDNNL